MLVVTQEGAEHLWQQMLKIADLGYPWVHLFASDYQPQHTDLYANYAAIEVPGSSGYAPIQLLSPGANWTIAPIGAGASATYVTLTWTLTGPATIWGYWIADGTNNWSLWAELFSGFFQYGAGGGIFLLQLQPWLASWPDVGGIPCTSP